MIQSINLLSDSGEEFRQKIYDEAKKNPALEIVSNDTFTSVSDRASSSELSDNYQAFLENSSFFEETLQDHLISQLGELKLTKREEECARTIIWNLNSKGYHIVPLENLFSSRDYPVAMKMLRIIQLFDPIGVAVKDLSESLYLQAKEKGADDFTLNFIKNYLNLLETIRIPLILRKLSEKGISSTEEQIEDVISFIRTLNPFPAQEFASSGSAVGGSTESFITPDVRVAKDDDKYRAVLVKENQVQVRLNDEYLKMKGKEAKNNILAAKNLINSIEMRNQTLEKVANIITEVQNDFFERGPEALKPLKMKDVAEKIGVHESTISRIAHKKYLECDRGTFALRYFFITETGSGEKKSGVSKEAAKAIISRLISENEAGGKAKISDQKLCELLEKKGIKIARRTVAKYRLELNIQSSYDR